jgi:hypothetical protein
MIQFAQNDRSQSQGVSDDFADDIPDFPLNVVISLTELAGRSRYHHQWMNSDVEGI